MPDTMQEVDKLEKQIGDLEEQIKKLTAKSGDAAAADERVSLDDDVKKAADDSSDDDDKLKKAVAKVVKAKKAPVDDSALDGEPEPDADDTGVDNWSDKGSKAKKAAPPEDDEAVDIEGQRVLKSVVGEGSFAILKGQAERIAKAEAAIAKAEDRAATAEFRKRADDMYKHVPGSVEQRGDLLKALATLPKPVREHFETVLSAHEKMAKAAFNRVGINPGDIDKHEKSSKGFEGKIGEITKRDSCTRTQAMEKARLEDPEGYAAYQQAS